MFIVMPIKKNASSKKLMETVKSILLQKNISVEVHQVADFSVLITYIDVRDYLPLEFLKKVEVSRLSVEDLKKLKKMAFKEAQKKEETPSIERAKQVKILSGPYKGMKGKLKRIFDGKAEVYVSVFGTPVSITVFVDDIIPTD
ncbi:MAG: KOW motif-containing protein [Candidatus Aenigmatarchaeota archaeon]